VRIASAGLDDDLSAVVVLGAGASRGASFVTDSGVLPPLDADFFEQVQRMPPRLLSTADRQLLQFIKEEFGMSGFPTLETFFTQVEAVDRFHHEFNIKGRVSTKFRKHLVTLRKLIPRVFGQALRGQTCTWHRRLAAALRTGDCVLSFNYDCLMDDALRSEAGKRWRAESGYAFPVDGAETWSGAPGLGARYRNPIKLLKPHGSLNWALAKDAKSVSLVEAYSPRTATPMVSPRRTCGCRRPARRAPRRHRRKGPGRRGR